MPVTVTVPSSWSISNKKTGRVKAFPWFIYRENVSKELCKSEYGDISFKIEACKLVKNTWRVKKS